MSSNEKLANGTTGYKITKDDLAQINRRNLLGFQDGWNYERMQHSGYLWIILPTLRKLYGDGTPELKEACRAQCAPFFNTSNFLNTIITGIDLAIEEEEGIEGLEAVAGLKTGLMGPLASIGDSIFGSLLPTISAGICIAKILSVYSPINSLLKKFPQTAIIWQLTRPMLMMSAILPKDSFRILQNTAIAIIPPRSPP